MEGGEVDVMRATNQCMSRAIMDHMAEKPRTIPIMPRRAALGRLAGGLAFASTMFAPPTSAPALAQATQGGVLRDLPPEALEALAKQKIPADAMVAMVQPLGAAAPRLTHRTEALVNPASLEKLVTTQAALDLLGPAWRWQTPVWIDGALKGDTLQGRVVIQGAGDPKLVVERVWLLLQRLQSLNVRKIQGDIVIDQSRFVIPPEAPEAFDNEPLRPYNVHPQALILNQKSVIYTFTPQPSRGVASVSALPALDAAAAQVPLSQDPCADWRLKLKARWMTAGAANDAAPFGGAYPVSCGERQWPAADDRPDSYHERMLSTLWRSMGGTLEGRVVESATAVRVDGAPSILFDSPPLADVVRDINKYSNNTMAKQLFLTLSLQRLGTGTWQGSRQEVQRWMGSWFKGSSQGLFVDNGSGLSREGRLSAQALTQLLHHAWRSPTMPDFVASLPASGLDGTLLRSKLSAGRAHLKTGSLRDVAGIAGYVLGESGRRHSVVAIINHERANAARSALEAVAQWAAADVTASLR
jgi:serine-type D-Ala-D-Ala carboxypeptidase/endopeptidase (penicillin-binding protein 4)